jgi:autotransporter-associated beta strand protein
LQIGNGTSGSIGSTASVEITYGATLRFEPGAEMTFSKVISGDTGKVEYSGSSTKKLILTGANTYTGTTTVEAGTLQIGNGAITTANINTTASVSVASVATLRFEPGANMTFSKVISGAGKVECKGSSSERLYFTANNTYTGTTTIESSSDFYIGNNTSSGAVAGNIINNGYLNFGRNNAYIYSGVISGTGVVYVNYNGVSNGDLTLTGANTYTGTTYIDKGKLILGTSGTIANSYGVTLNHSTAKLDISAGNKTIKELDASNSYTDAEVILGNKTLTIGTAGQSGGGGAFPGKFTGTGGSVTKTGMGTLTMSGANTATGTFTHSQGTVILGGTWAGDYSKAAGTTLTVSGTPTIGGNLALVGGVIGMTLAGSSPAKLSVTGAVSATGTNTLNIITNAVSDYILIQAASGLGSTIPFTVDLFPPDNHYLLTATGTQLLLTASATPLIPAITTETLPSGLTGTPYSETLAATGMEPITWSLESGTPPAGLSLASDGVISGTPATAGTSTFTVKATNAAGTDTKELSILITTTVIAPIITTTTLPDGTAGQEYNQNLVATGTSPIAWSLESGNLPNGLDLSSNGVISGAPTTEGTFNFTVKAQNSAGSDTQTLSIKVNSATQPPHITTETLPDGIVGTPYSQTLAAIGDVPIVWSLLEGALPNGLDLNGNGVISGVPTTEGTFNFIVKAQNNAGVDTKVFSIKVDSNTQPPHITTETLPDGAIGIPYNETLAATGAAPITWMLASGNLPTGLNLYGNGVISGTPTTTGTFNFTVQAQNNLGTDLKILSIRIDAVGIEETLRAPSVQVYPNPTRGELTIVYPTSDNPISDIEIFDLMGRLVETLRATSVQSTPATIDISHLANGIYFIRIQTENGMVTKKIIKQ